MMKLEQEEFSQRVLIKNILKGGESVVGQSIKVGGWVMKGREGEAGKTAFLEVNDGSCPDNIQLVVKSSLWSPSRLTPTGTSVHVEGEVVMPPKDNIVQKIEVMVTRIIEVGIVDPLLPKSKFTDIMSAVANRIGGALALATHQFFLMHHFFYIHTPLITTNDCEGGGEMFQLRFNPPPSPAHLHEAAELVKDKAAVVSQLKEARAASSETDDELQITAAISELKIGKQNLSKLEESSKLKPGIAMKGDVFDYSKDFFGHPAHLAVSSQLHAETCASDLGRVYTFVYTFGGPTAEPSHTSRHLPHLAEFWMVEQEMAFSDLEDNMRCAEAYVKYMCQWLLDNNLDLLKLITDKSESDNAAIDRLRMVVVKDFIRVSYTEAITILEEAAKEHKFENEVKWGVDLASEHERYLTEVKYESPVIVHDYPKEIKPFYMKVNSDNRTVAAMDVLVPKVGKLIGGSQREDCPNVLARRMWGLGIPPDYIQWYMDYRQHGTVGLGGFGLGFERMVLFATGLDNIRDVIPFPGYPGRADP